MFRILIHGNYIPTGPFHYPSNHSSPALMAAVFEYLTSISFSKSCPFSKPITLLCCYSDGRCYLWWIFLWHLTRISISIFAPSLGIPGGVFFICYFCTVTVFYSHEVNHGHPSFTHTHIYICYTFAFPMQIAYLFSEGPSILVVSRCLAS